MVSCENGTFLNEFGARMYSKAGNYRFSSQLSNTFLHQTHTQILQGITRSSQKIRRCDQDRNFRDFANDKNKRFAFISQQNKEYQVFNKCNFCASAQCTLAHEIRQIVSKRSLTYGIYNNNTQEKLLQDYKLTLTKALSQSHYICRNNKTRR